MRDDELSPEELETVDAALKRLPYLAPSPDFADRVMARVYGFETQAPVVARQPRLRVEPSQRYGHPRAAAIPAPRRALVSFSPAFQLAFVAVTGVIGLALGAMILASLLQMETLSFLVALFGAGTGDFLAAAITSAATGGIGDAGATTVAGAASGGTAIVMLAFGAGIVAGVAGLRAAASRAEVRSAA